VTPFVKWICEWSGAAAIFRPFVNLISEWCRYSSNGFANGDAICQMDFQAAIFRPFVNLISEWCSYSSNSFANKWPWFGKAICEWC
jgi:hypothetical protein